MNRGILRTLVFQDIFVPRRIPGAANLVSGRSQAYTYDEMNRLATAQSTATSGANCWSEQYTYDRYANLSQIGPVSGGCAGEYLSLGINTANNRVTNTGFTYDAAGNVATDGYSSFTWNAEGRMSATAGYTYLYDGDGRRVAKIAGGHSRGSSGRNPVRQTRNPSGKLYWYGVNGEVLAESDLSGNITAEYIYFNGQRIVRCDPTTYCANVYYYLADRLGSARVMTNATGGVVEESDFYPYGGERVITDTLDNNYKFTGHERDAESGLDHTLHRQYSSNLGRWHSPDRHQGTPANPQSLNRYSYGANSPCNFTDPDGRIISNASRRTDNDWLRFAVFSGAMSRQHEIDGDAPHDSYEDDLNDLVKKLGVNKDCARALDGLGKASTEIVQRIKANTQLFKDKAAKYGIDYHLLGAIATVESDLVADAWNANPKDPDNPARGMFQLTRKAFPNISDDDAKNPLIAADTAAEHIRWLMNQLTPAIQNAGLDLGYRDWLTASAYNLGLEGTKSRLPDLDRISRVTEGYANNVLAGAGACFD